MHPEMRTIGAFSTPFTWEVTGVLSFLVCCGNTDSLTSRTHASANLQASSLALLLSPPMRIHGYAPSPTRKAGDGPKFFMGTPTVPVRADERGGGREGRA